MAVPPASGDDDEDVADPPVELLAQLPAPPRPGVSVDAVRFEVRAVEVEPPSEDACDVTAVLASGLPAVRDDGQRVAYVEQSGSDNAEELDRDHDLVVLDRSGTTRARVRLWTAAEVETLGTSTDCAAWRRTMQERAEQARAALEGRAWRSLAPMAVHLDRVRDLGDASSVCTGFVPPPVVPAVPGEPPWLVTCNHRPQTLEVAVVAGPALVVRIPGVEVLHRQPEPALQMTMLDEWEQGACSRKPTIEAGWHDAASGLVLVRIEGEGYGMDACDYVAQVRVLDLPSAGWPALPWGRQASSVERFDPELPGAAR